MATVDHQPAAMPPGVMIQTKSNRINPKTPLRGEVAPGATAMEAATTAPKTIETRMILMTKIRATLVMTSRRMTLRIVANAINRHRLGHLPEALLRAWLPTPIRSCTGMTRLRSSL